MPDPAMNSLIRHRRLLETLRAAEQTRRLLDDASEPSQAKLSATLDALHLELGRELHRMFRGEREQPAAAPRPDIGPPTPPPAREATEISFDDEDTLTPVSSRAHSVDPSWVRRLRSVVRAYGLVERLDDPSDLALEASRLQWATRELDRWTRFPNAIQVALLGAFAARARHLETGLQTPVAANLALERLREYRKVAGLSWVTGLVPDRGPEHATWAEDAAHWWRVLIDGLGTRSGASP